MTAPKLLVVDLSEFNSEDDYKQCFLAYQKILRESHERPILHVDKSRKFGAMGALYYDLTARAFVLDGTAGPTE